MAFIKKCISTVIKCVLCGKPGITQIKEKWFCSDCIKKIN